MPKVAIIGAGSTVFATELMRDILAIPDLSRGVFALVDIDVERLELAVDVAELLIQRSGKDWTVTANKARRAVLSDCDYVINTIDVGGLANVRHDYDIPLKYGVDQCIGDTIGPGGLFKALRTLPEWLAILSDVEQLAPGSLVLNYTNPMSISVLAGLRASKLPIVGLCHSVQHTSSQLAGYLEIPYNDLTWRVGGINHMAWFVELSRHAEDLYPLLRQRAKNAEVYARDPVRFEVMFELGAFVTESSGHFSEYVPFFRKRPDLIAKYMRSGYRGESGYYANNWPAWRSAGDQKIRAMLAGERDFPLQRGVEYASYIIEAMESGKPAVIYGNVLNTGLIENLAQNGVVEVACLVDGRGVQPLHFGALPTHLAALNARHIAFHDLTVTAILEQNREAAVRALMLDPLTSAVCSLSEIRQMFTEMCSLQSDYLPEFLR
jgi:alpha-galactosidase